MRAALGRLPGELFADYEALVAQARITCTIELRSVTYNVHSRLIGHQLTVHLRHDLLDLFMRRRFMRREPPFQLLPPA